MTADPAGLADGDPELIGRCYTKARRTPLVVGVIPGGAGRSLRLAGGPYTITQLGAMVATVVLLVLTRPLWGGHGLVDVVVLLGAPFGAAFLLRYLHIDGRNPAAALASVVVMLTAPRGGRLHGRPFRPARPGRVNTLVTVGAAGPDGTAVEHVAVPIAAEVRSQQQAQSATAAPQPEARPAPPLSAPVASGVQALLARRTNSGD